MLIRGKIPGLALILALEGMLLAGLAWNEFGRQEAGMRAAGAGQAIARANSAAREVVQDMDDAIVAALLGRAGLGPASARTQAVAELDALRRELRDDRDGRDGPTRSALASDLAANARALETWVAGTEALVQAGRGQEVAALVDSEGMRLREEVLASLERFEAEELRLGQEWLERLDEKRRMRGGLLAAAAALNILVAVLLLRRSGPRLPEEVRSVAPPPRHTVQQLAETLRQREAALAESAEELAEANKELHRRTQDMEAFLRGVSHDLGSPLHNIKVFSRELELTCGDLEHILSSANLDPALRSRFGALEKDTHESVYYLQTAVASADRILTGLQQLARAGHRHFEWQTLDVQKIVRRVVDAMHSTIVERNATVTVGELPHAWGDGAAVEQIFFNLLKNAVAYLDPSRPGRIEVGAMPAQTGQPVVYWVRDNGVGVSAAHLSTIFTGFHRGRSDLAEGEGIGLALVHRAVTRLGGKIRVESTEGEGATFYVTLRTAHDRKATPLPFSSDDVIVD